MGLENSDQDISASRNYLNTLEQLGHQEIISSIQTLDLLKLQRAAMAEISDPRGSPYLEFLDSVITDWQHGDRFIALGFFLSKAGEATLRGSLDNTTVYIKCCDAILAEPIFTGEDSATLYMKYREIALQNYQKTTNPETDINGILALALFYDQARFEESNPQVTDFLRERYQTTLRDHLKVLGMPRKFLEKELSVVKGYRGKDQDILLDRQHLEDLLKNFNLRREEIIIHFLNATIESVQKGRNEKALVYSKLCDLLIEFPIFPEEDPSRFPNRYRDLLEWGRKTVLSLQRQKSRSKTKNERDLLQDAIVVSRIFCAGVEYNKAKLAFPRSRGEIIKKRYAQYKILLAGLLRSKR
ncbi:hypothetical protein HYT59_01305 [Candidatus Woesebacteria bacterium]|nr:hypothetical protein [Candidatus Woesebacteria bacterium]